MSSLFLFIKKRNEVKKLETYIVEIKSEEKNKYVIEAESRDSAFIKAFNDFINEEAETSYISIDITKVDETDTNCNDDNNLESES